jgi:uncharacterized OsmC-like protein
LPVQQVVTVQQLDGKKLPGVARQHAVITDRPVPDGGGDPGCTSGELLLLAIGSCVAGSLRNCFAQKGLQHGRLKVEVGLKPSAVRDPLDRIVIALYLSVSMLRALMEEAIRIAATSGAVAGTVGQGSEVELRIVRSANSE